MENIYLTIYTVQAFIPAAFMWFTAFFLLSIPKRSIAATHLALGLLLFGTIPVSYLITSSWYDTLVSYNRWIAAYISIPSILHLILFLINFPEPTFPRFSKYLLRIGWTVTVFFWVLFIYSIRNANPVYNFSGHYWDLQADQAQKIVTLFILVGVIALISTSIWRSIKIKSWILGAGFILFGVGPAIGNVLSRDGIIDRGQFLTIYNLMTVSGIFLFLIAFLNYTKDKTSFMVKIIGVSLLTFLLLLHFLTYILLITNEKNFDFAYSMRSALVTTKQFQNQKSAIFHSFDPIAYQLVSEQSDPIVEVPESAEYYNTFIYEKLNAIGDSPEFVENAKKVLNEANHPYFQGIKLELLDTLSKGKTSKALLLKQIQQIETYMSRFRFKVQKIPTNLFSSQIQPVIEKDFKKMHLLKSYLLEHRQKQTNSNSLKSDILKMTSAFLPSGNRFYREGVNNQHYISYIIIDLNRNLVFEVGYDYLEYRKYLHSSSILLISILAFATFFIVFGFKFIFQKSLVDPLESLLSGVKKIKSGELNVNLNVYMEDEIGYLTRSFNEMAISIQEAQTKLEDYASNLEDKVNQRTEELSKTLQQVQSLKQQQDGDYYLTSLLIKPLGRNYSHSEKVIVKSIVSQKKKFHFRKWDSEIGGDICIAYSLKLNKRPMTIFLNADAMGKSIQGAGGALVIGSVFQSIVDRTSIAASYQDIYPEKWLKHTFLELHRIFETFDGSMLVSLVIGIVDDNSGFLYYINAEHPYTVLYRDGKASFIDEGLVLRKLGMIGIDGHIQVNTFQLMEDDLLIVGSDGRDDILISTLEDGQRVINEDETLFLKHVEKGKGELENIYQSIKGSGEITDDLSLLSIHYIGRDVGFNYSDEVRDLLVQARQLHKAGDIPKAHEVIERALKVEPNNVKLLKFLVNMCVREKDYSKASELCEEIVALRPWETEYMFVYSKCLQKSSNFMKAIDIGERIRIREPHLIKNLVHLSELYLRIHNLERAKMIAHEAKQVNPTDSRLVKILQVLT